MSDKDDKDLRTGTTEKIGTFRHWDHVLEVRKNG